MEICKISHQTIDNNSGVLIATIHHNIQTYLLQKYPELKETDWISISTFKKEKFEYIQELIAHDKNIINSINQNIETTVSANNVDNNTTTNYSIGAKVADKVASFGGSWTFNIIFFVFIIGWMMINTMAIMNKPYDPYPFILLNLILSCLAAIQAPIIMMSQNRQEEKDRLRANYDYEINIKAEKEVEIINAKLDYLITTHLQETHEIFQHQIESIDMKIQQLSNHYK